MAVKIENNNYYDMHEVAKIFNCSTRTVKRYAEAGKIEGNKLGRTWYFSKESVNKYITGKANGNNEK